MTRVLLDHRLVRVTCSHRPSGGMGRFGGGWNWKVGFQSNRRVLLLSALVAEVKIARPYVPPPPVAVEPWKPPPKVHFG